MLLQQVLDIGQVRQKQTSPLFQMSQGAVLFLPVGRQSTGWQGETVVGTGSEPRGKGQGTAAQAIRSGTTCPLQAPLRGTCPPIDTKSTAHPLFFPISSSIMQSEHLHDDVCLVIDMDGFRVDGRFQCRELGYCSWLGDSGRLAFKPFKSFRHLIPEERRGVHHVYKRIHGMSYYPDPREEIGTNPSKITKALYNDFSTEHRFRVAFKGGHLEKDVLLRLNLPYLDLEKIGCPTYDHLRMSYDEDLWEGCEWHAIPSAHHCAMTEGQAFFTWYTNYMQAVQ